MDRLTTIFDICLYFTGCMMIGVVVVAVAIVLGLVVAGQLVTQSIQDNTIKAEGAKLTAVEDIDKMVSIQQQLAAIDAVGIGPSE